MQTRLQKKKQNDLKKISCIICLAPCLQSKVTVCCSGCYHEECLSKWYSMTGKCPICKKDIEPSDTTDADYIPDKDVDV